LKAITEIISQDDSLISYIEDRGAVSRKHILGLIDTTLATDSYLKSVIVVAKDGEIISNESKIDMTVSGDMMDEAWYVDALGNNNMPSLTSIRRQEFKMDKDSWVISISKEIVNSQGHNLGVLLLDIDYAVIDEYLKKISLGKEGYAFILNESNQLVYHPDVAYFEPGYNIDDLIEMKQKTDGYDRESETMTHHDDIENTDWCLVGVSSLDDLRHFNRQVFEAFILMGVIVILAIIGSGYFIARRVTNPILQLEKAMTNIDEGLNKVSMEKFTSIEIADLARHYNEMIDKILNLMDQIKDKEQYLRNYEINALQSQINPHFLYNTLDTIVWMAEFGDSERVIAVTKALANFFRISLSNGNKMITIEEELKHVEEYLFIQKHRYEDQLSYDIQFDVDILKVEVPKIILQPIVENAIYHGIREKEGLGFVAIKIHQYEGNIQLIVEDNGVGYDEKTESKKTKLGGVGLENVNQRIKLSYGETYGLTIKSMVGQGTTVIITIPRR